MELRHVAAQWFKTHPGESIWMAPRRADVQPAVDLVQRIWQLRPENARWGNGPGVHDQQFDPTGLTLVYPPMTAWTQAGTVVLSSMTPIRSGRLLMSADAR